LRALYIVAVRDGGFAHYLPGVGLAADCGVGVAARGAGVAV
jgi:hypothetical protein